MRSLTGPRASGVCSSHDSRPMCNLRPTYPFAMASTNNFDGHSVAGPSGRCCSTEGRGVRARSTMSHVPALSHVLEASQIISITPVLTSNMSTVEEPPADTQRQLATLAQYYKADGSVKDSLHRAATEAASGLHRTVAEAVNSKSSQLRSLQTSLVGSGAIGALMHLAARREPVAYDALQILCYRNVIVCQQILGQGVVDRISLDMPLASTTLQCAMCHLLTALAAFSEESHALIAGCGLVPQLVVICRATCKLHPAEDDTPETRACLESRATAVLRSLAHNTKQHPSLFKSGAVDALVQIMHQTTDPASRINAALAVACLVGHEEKNPQMQLDEELVDKLLEVLEAACMGRMAYGTFWTLWKLCQGIACLTGNDRNKDLITARGGVELMAEVLHGRHFNNEAAHRYALSSIWNLAFNDHSRKVILGTPGLVDSIRNCLATTESPKTREVAKGALWTLGVENDIKAKDEISVHKVQAEVVEAKAGNHVMLSYEWGHQESVMLIKNELQKAGYTTWMDVDEMSGSTLEAMAQAVENSAVVILCISSKYKESQACRTEAEYAFQQRKKIVPVLMEKGYKATGWLGALMGTRLYFEMSDPRRIPGKAVQLFKELGDAGKPLLPGAISGAAERRSEGLETLELNLEGETPEEWSISETEEWLKRIKYDDYRDVFRAKNMDGMALSGLLRMSTDTKLVHEVLVSEFGMVTLGQRLRLIEELHRLFV